MKCEICGYQERIHCNCFMHDEFDELNKKIDSLTHEIYWLRINLNGRIEYIEQKLENIMDKDYKKVEKEAGKLKSDIKKVEAKDMKRDKYVEAGKKALKKKK